MSYQTGVILVSLLFSAFFSGVEIAYISADKLRIELLFQKGTITGRILSHFQNNRAGFLATTLVGNNLALVIYGIYMAYLIEPLLSENLPAWASEAIVLLILQTLIATFVVLVTAEFLPKSLFIINPDVMLTVFVVPMFIIYILLYPVVKVVEVLSKLMIIYVLRQDYSESKPVFALTDLNNYIKKNVIHHGDEAPEVDPKIFHNALEFKEVKVRECMVPRTEIVAVDVSDTVETLKKAFIDSGHSKILVYKETIDDIIGYCHSLVLFKKPKDIREILTPIPIVPETMPANEMLIQLINTRKSLALVVDEFGGTSGIVSIEDVIEEIFGEIQDEHDDESLVEEKVGPNSYILSARHEIDYLNDKFEWNLPEGEYDTLGGYILEENENIPAVNDLIVTDICTLQIVSMEENRIDKVKLTIRNSEEPL